MMDCVNQVHFGSGSFLVKYTDCFNSDTNKPSCNVRSIQGKADLADADRYFSRFKRHTGSRLPLCATILLQVDGGFYSCRHKPGGFYCEAAI